METDTKSIVCVYDTFYKYGYRDKYYSTYLDQRIPIFHLYSGWRFTWSWMVFSYCYLVTCCNFIDLLFKVSIIIITCNPEKKKGIKKHIIWHKVKQKKNIRQSKRVKSCNTWIICSWIVRLGRDFLQPYVTL